MELEDLTRHVLQETLRQFNESKPGGSYDVGQKRFLIVMTGGETGINHGIDFVKQCVAKKVSFSLVLSNSATKLLATREWSNRTGALQVITESSMVPVIELLNEHQQIVVPILTVNSTAKVAAGISDTLATNIIFHGLLMGKPVLAARESCDPDYLPYFVQEGNPGAKYLQAKLRENMTVLETMGVKFHQADQFAELLEFGEKANIIPPVESMQLAKPSLNRHIVLNNKVITEGDLASIQPEAKVEVSRHTIITPSAKDIAQEKRISFSRKD